MKAVPARRAKKQTFYSRTFKLSGPEINTIDKVKPERTPLVRTLELHEADDGHVKLTHTLKKNDSKSLLSGSTSTDVFCYDNYGDLEQLDGLSSGEDEDEESIKVDDTIKVQRVSRLRVYYLRSRLRTLLSIAERTTILA